MSTTGQDKSSCSTQGLHLIAEPSVTSDTPPPGQESHAQRGFDLDIVAIHGMSGTLEDAFVSKKTGYSWLQDALPQMNPKARVLGYNYRGTPENVVNGLLQDLIDDRGSQRATVPILLVGYSLGGTLAKQLFLSSSPSRNSRPKVRQLHAAIKGFVFIGTRQRGRYNMVDFLRGISIFRSWADVQLDALKSTHRINHDFRMLGGESLPIACLGETVETPLEGFVVSEKDATLDGAEYRELHAKHEDMCRFDDPDDPNCKKVLASVRSISEKIENLPAPVRSQTPSPRPSLPTDLRILSLDGGGVRGLFSIIVLERIMEEVRKIDNPAGKDALKPCDYFDLIVGTSTGGILGIMLGRLRMDIISCKDAYESLSSSIFKQNLIFPVKEIVDIAKGIIGHSRFPAEGLENAVKGVVAKRLGGGETSALASQGIAVSDAPLRADPETGTKTVVCAVVDNDYETQRLRTYTPNSHVPASPACTIWQACRATSAAPLYFPAMEIDNQMYFDGGMKSNNPILEAVEEAILERHDPGHPGASHSASFRAIVSLGTGKPEQTKPGRNIIGIAKYALTQMTDTQAKHEEFLHRFPDIPAYSDLQPDDPNACYFRLNEETTLYDIDLADWKRLGEIKMLAEAYVASEGGEAAIKACAAKVAQKTVSSVQSVKL